MKKLVFAIIVFMSVNCFAELYFSNIHENINNTVSELFERPGNFENKAEIAILLF